MFSAVLASLLATPVVASDSSPRGTDQGSEQCLTLAVDHLATKLGVVVNVFGVIALGVTSPAPGEGLSAIVYIIPSLCSADVTALMPSFGQIEVPKAATYDLIP